MSVSVKIKIVDPSHCLCGDVLDAEKSTREHGAVSYFIVAIRPFDPDKPMSDEYRRFCQVLAPKSVEEITK